MCEQKTQQVAIFYKYLVGRRSGWQDIKPIYKLQTALYARWFKIAKGMKSDGCCKVVLHI